MVVEPVEGGITVEKVGRGFRVLRALKARRVKEAPLDRQEP